ncbi:hypothetical protein EUGRSUZ_J02103 [Eucalyptus grandis]|uniref:Uncharacterized protein n=2 Tax=Eucalyptus grandis TaxID=71139 RepID=A0ACC3J7H2_EUCGR|nr:hypothetical protein EUGRSUZ_J02103 [Eucalyptus grandis]
MQDTMAIASDVDIVFISDGACVNLICRDFSWVVDSTASIYVTSQCDNFTSYHNDDFSCIKLGNRGVFKIIK